MKQLKITLKHVMLIVALTFSAISCQKEEVIQTEVIRIENQTSNYKIQNIGKDIISKNKILSEKLLAFSSKSTDKNSSMSLRDVYNEAYDFTIETDQAIYIENSQYHSYTFTIYRDEPNNLVENLVFSLQDDGSYKTILMKYSLTNEDINAILNNEETQISYDNKVDWETLDINLDGLLYKNYQIGNNLYYNSDSGYCYKEIGIISAATGWEDTQQQVVDCPNDLDTEHFSEDDGGGFTTTNNPDTDPTDTNNPNGGETGNTGNTSNPGNTSNNPPADITTPNISISEQILNCLNSNININNPVYYDNAFLRSLGLNLSDLRNYLITQNQCSEQAKAFTEAAIEAIDNGGDVDLTNAIILDETVQSNQKVKCVYDKLKTLSNTIFKDIINNQFGSSNNNHVKITIVNLPAQISPNTLAYTYTTYDSNSTNPLNSGDIKHIRIDPTFAQNGSTLEIALVLIHEFIHAELIGRCIKLGLVQSQNTLGATILNNNPNTIYTFQGQIFNLLLNQYNAFPPSANSQWQHDLFNALSYRTKMAQNLVSVNSLLNDSSNDFLTNVNNDPSIVGGPYTISQLMDYISWIGLEQTQDYATNISSIPTELAKKQYIEGVANTKYTHNCTY